MFGGKCGKCCNWIFWCNSWGLGNCGEVGVVMNNFWKSCFVFVVFCFIGLGCRFYYSYCIVVGSIYLFWFGLGCCDLLLVG